MAIYRAYPPTDLPPAPGFRYLNFVTSLGIYLSLLKVKGILKGVDAVAALDLSNAGTPELFQLLPANVAGSSHHIHGNRLLHRQLEQNAADPVVTVIHDTLDRGRDDLGQIIAAILRGNIANVKMDCFLDELTLAGTVIRLIPLAHLLQRGFTSFTPPVFRLFVKLTVLANKWRRLCGNTFCGFTPEQ